MANKSLGFITVTSAGTKVRFTAGLSSPTERLGAHSYLVEVGENNTGNIYIGGANMNTSTGADVYAILPPPTLNIFPSFSSNVVEAAAAFALNELFLDAEVSGNKALVSYIEA